MDSIYRSLVSGKSYYMEGVSAKGSTKPVGLSISRTFTHEKVTLHDTGPVLPDRPSHIPKTQTPHLSAAGNGSATSQGASYL